MWTVGGPTRLLGWEKQDNRAYSYASLLPYVLPCGILTSCKFSGDLYPLLLGTGFQPSFPVKPRTLPVVFPTENVLSCLVFNNRDTVLIRAQKKMRGKGAAPGTLMRCLGRGKAVAIGHKKVKEEGMEDGKA